MINTEARFDRRTPGLLGAAFLLQAAASLVSTFLRTPLIVPGKIVDSMANIASKALQMRVSIVAEMIAIIGIVMLGALLFVTLKEQNGKIATVALGLYIVTAAIIAVSRVAAYALLRISQESVLAGHPAHLVTLGNLFYELQEFGYFLHMLPYTLGAAMFYYLLTRSRYVPRAISLFGLVAAVLALVGSLCDHLGVAVPLFVFLPNLPFDLGIGLWLLIKGISDTSGPE